MPGGWCEDAIMRTTIRIDDALYREVKQRAAAAGRPVSAVLEDAVRSGLRGSERPARGRYRVRPSGSGGLRPGVDLDHGAELREVLDEESSLDALR
jgi:Arc/MetJ family transcription regulator